MSKLTSFKPLAELYSNVVKSGKTSPFNSIQKNNSKILNAIKATRGHVPPKPVKPYSTWVAFVKEHKDEVLAGRSLKAPQLARIMSQKWKEADKTRYEEEYRQRCEKFKEEREKYYNGLSLEEEENLKISLDLKKYRKSLKQINRTYPPSLPRNAANLYIHERFKEPEVQERVKKSSLVEVMKELFAEYRSLPAEEKQKYVELREKDKSRFKGEFNDWYENTKNDERLNKLSRKQIDVMYARAKAMYFI